MFDDEKCEVLKMFEVTIKNGKPFAKCPSGFLDNGKTEVEVEILNIGDSSITTNSSYTIKIKEEELSLNSQISNIRSISGGYFVSTGTVTSITE
ncbi:MAG: hypothetical protein OHK0017_06440 [Patescibacteria group bacterium]